MPSSPRLGLIGLGFNVLSLGILSAEYLLFGHVRLLALTVCLWLMLFYGLYRLQPAESRMPAPGVMESLCGFGVIFQLVSFFPIAFRLSGWAAMAPELVFLAGLVCWLMAVLHHRHVQESDTVVVYAPAEDGWLRPRSVATQDGTPAGLADFMAEAELLSDPLGADIRRRPVHQSRPARAARHAAE